MRYRCGACGETYNTYDYQDLDRQPLNPEDDDPKQGSGYEAVCRDCGSGFHSDKWTLRDTVETEEFGEVTVSTVALLIAHGPSHDQWFETCLFHDNGSQVTDRYGAQMDAVEGHGRTVDRLERGEYSVTPTGQRIDLLPGGGGA